MGLIIIIWVSATKTHRTAKLPEFRPGPHWWELTAPPRRTRLPPPAGNKRSALRVSIVQCPGFHSDIIMVTLCTIIIIILDVLYFLYQATYHTYTRTFDTPQHWVKLNWQEQDRNDKLIMCFDCSCQVKVNLFSRIWPDIPRREWRTSRLHKCLEIAWVIPILLNHYFHSLPRSVVWPHLIHVLSKASGS